MRATLCCSAAQLVAWLVLSSCAAVALDTGCCECLI